MLALDGVEVRFGGLRALAGFSMTVEPGTIHALIGPNGAGKSTVFNCVSRFYMPAAGDIRFEGRSILPLPSHAIAGLGIGRTFQNIELCGRLSVLDNVLVGMTPAIPDTIPFWPTPRRRAAEAAAKAEAMALLERVGLADLARQPAESLDFGRQKMLDLVRALACKPRLLLLDEPAAGLRNREIKALDRLLVELAREQGVTILLVEHVMQLVMAVADRITVLNFGEKIAEGLPAEIRAHPKVVEAYLGRDAAA